MHAHAHTHVHIHAHKAKSLAATKWSHQPLGCLGTALELRASAGKSTWGMASTGLYHAQGDGEGTKSPTWATYIIGLGDTEKRHHDIS